MTDINETGAEAVTEKGSIDHLGSLVEDTFDYKVPADSPVEADRGKEVKDNKFNFRQITTPDEANAVIAAKGWDLVEMVNKILKANARSNAYQSALAPHKVSDVDPEKVFESTVRNMVRQGIPESMARELLKNTLATVKS